MFDDGPENHSAYIVPPESGSQFAIGYTLDDKGKIADVGVYYTMNRKTFN